MPAIAPTDSSRVDSLILRRAGGITLAVGIIATLIGWLAVGTTGLIGGLMGMAVVLVFFSIGQGILGWVLRNNPQIALMVALGVYLVKIGLLFVLIVILQDATFFNSKVFAITIVVCTIAWTGAEVWVYSKTKVLYVEPEGVK